MLQRAASIVRQEFLRHGRAVVRERKIDVERQRTRLARDAREHGLGFSKLRVGEARRGDTHFGFLQILDAEDLALRFRFGAGRKVFAETFAVDSGIDLKNDFPGGIREF